MEIVIPLAATTYVPAPGWWHVLTAWTFAPFVVVPIAAAAGLYLAGARRVGDLYPRSPWPQRRVAWFLSGLALLVLVLNSPIDVYAGIFLWVHMIQHVVLMTLAPVCLLLGAPITLALRASTPATRRRWLLPILHSRPVKVLTFPVVSWALFAAAMVFTHFSPLYEAALQSPWVHVGEHAIYLSTGLLFWWPVVGLDPGAWRLSFPARLFYVFLAAPVNTFTALAIFSATDVLYPHYLLVARTWGPSPLTDQHWGGALMWIAGDLILLGSVTILALAWMRHDQLEAARIDARLDREEEAAQRARAMGGG
ncbi:MAG TPA: cytochrome c oxidase assembly protein [Actinomycetota bacterium]|jgi:putative copper resistance protein D